MFRHLRPVWAEVDLDKLAYNMREIRRISKSKNIIAVVKADGYGHGAVDIAPVLLQNGANGLAVAVISEAVELRRAGIEAPIMVLGFTPPNLIDNLLRYDIEQTVINYEFAKELSNMARKKNKIAKIHIAVDTGMGRIGFLPNDRSVDEIYKISQLSNIEIEGLFSHFSSADEGDKEYTKLQVERFNDFYNKLKNLNIKINNRHIGNSAAIIDLPETHFEAVRPGIILYGYYPSNEVVKQKIKLKPVMSLKSNIIHIKTLPPGEHISYGRRFKTERESIIATLPVGYADGYTRLLFGKARVIVNGKFAPVVGTICMDQCMIDVTSIDGVELGNEVILIGEDDHNNKFTADNVAELLGTINYEIVCAINKRVPRVYIKGGKVIKVRNYV
ncbi:alanine racemase [Clostridium argentinense CDC 2741]|uniref:Alanine racemase n=1 Tax=Clostridium argentinense CDC 2741 TaxID=1418104 RepID=A0A0C1TWD4_9CLOT|nr:alanine racemase [Clostridium argentinense]ARC84033.1 alanine racemase [Clostridium argentinense]KIE45004.1 alanine racemase [Clostridium argentinense CDC 2741]NFF39361.1 alanine racemase [Clostridium argentinense]NFP50434.1 alanine racemase [Clostridium argentinense]NFP73342.1 alanine racemase [Clostridium argentinense]